ncbi:hypothetical protein GCL60_09910 [Silvanigrella paludirubra]|uniref:Uncharacterized protein n=1 Tax=Silvanigrella paludirubra TaxID=2499159 RepID=A0A6N6VU28_9BACT|nr:hypothetical protein [Silvanigrella paludirubra]KAB8039161.1 hypothetical protein GCL60_09910 [Silvanigrella paludirubra]
MRYSFLFTLLIDNIPEDQFVDLSASLIKFLIELEINLKKVIMNRNCGIFEVHDCDVLYFGDFINFAENNFKKIIWEKNFLPFEFGAVITEGINAQSFDLDDFNNFKKIEVAS